MLDALLMPVLKATLETGSAAILMRIYDAILTQTLDAILVNAFHVVIVFWPV